MEKAKILASNKAVGLMNKLFMSVRCKVFGEIVSPTVILELL